THSPPSQRVDRSLQGTPPAAAERLPVADSRRQPFGEDRPSLGRVAQYGGGSFARPDVGPAGPGADADRRRDPVRRRPRSRALVVGPNRPAPSKTGLADRRPQLLHAGVSVPVDTA